MPQQESSFQAMEGLDASDGAGTGAETDEVRRGLRAHPLRCAERRRRRRYRSERTFRRWRIALRRKAHAGLIAFFEQICGFRSNQGRVPHVRHLAESGSPASPGSPRPTASSRRSIEAAPTQAWLRRFDTPHELNADRHTTCAFGSAPGYIVIDATGQRLWLDSRPPDHFPTGPTTPSGQLIWRTHGLTSRLTPKRPALL